MVKPNFAYPNFTPGRHRLPADFQLTPDLGSIDLLSVPVTPTIPPLVMTGDLITAAHMNTVRGALGDLWTDVQYLDTAKLADPLTTRGDLLARTTVTTRLAVGADGQVLTADSTQAEGIKWAPLPPAGVSSVFGRAGAVVAQTGDYDVSQVTNAASLAGSYADPAWITSLAWSKITGAPASVPATRAINTTAPLTGGGDLSADRTLAVADATASSKGVVQPDGTTIVISGGVITAIGGGGGGGSQTPWAQDINAATFKLNNAGNVGIGQNASTTTTRLLVNQNTATLPLPLSGSVVHVGASDTQTPRILLDGFGAFPTFAGRCANGTGAAPTAAAAGFGLALFAGLGRGATNYATATRGHFGVYASEAWTDAAQGTYLAFHTTADTTVTTNEKMRLTNAGRLGIGKTNPGYALDVTGDINCSGVFRVGGVAIGGGGSQTPWTSDIDAAGNQLNGLGAAVITGTLDAGNVPSSFGLDYSGGLSRLVSWGPNTSTRGGFQFIQVASDGSLTNVPVQITAAGNVGIGTVSPTQPLTVNSNGYPQALIRSASGETSAALDFLSTGAAGRNHRILSGPDGSFYLCYDITANAARVMVSTAGNVGIGTANPEGRLTLSGGAFLTLCGALGARPAVGTTRIAGEISAASTGATDDAGFLRLSAGGGTSVGNRSYIDISGYSGVADLENTIALGTRSTERMRINNVGYVGIGTKNPGEPLTIDPGKIWLKYAGGTGAGLWLDSNTTVQACFQGLDAGVANNWRLYSALVGNNVFVVDLLNARVGIGVGVITPAYALDVVGTVRATSFIGGGLGGVSTQNVVTGSRAINGTVYQNIDTKPRFVTVVATTTSGQMNAYADSSGAPSTQVAATGQSGGANVPIGLSFYVLPNHYYKVTAAGGSVSLSSWIEWI